ncbi:MAG: TonB-dependent receptor [Planctomycetes bacterium]|nr:TonB-dependent receptor [Planctomycetota bacterium]
MPKRSRLFLPIASWFGLIATLDAAAQQVDHANSQSAQKTKAETIQEKQKGVHIADEILVIGRLSSGGVPQIPINYPASRDILDPATVKAIGARDLNDLVLHLPAISTRPYNGGEASTPSFSARGLPDDGLTEYLHVLVNGVPANAAPYGWTAFSFMPLAAERVYAIDLIRGGHSVRYSPNTVGGVLNFATRPLPDSQELVARQSFGSNAFSSSFLTGGDKTADGTAFRFSLLDRRGDGYRDGGGFMQQDFSAELRQDLEDGGWVAGSLNYFQDDHAAPGGLTVAEFNADRYANSRPENQFTGFRGMMDLVWHRPVSDAWYEYYATASVTERNLYARRVSGGSNVLDDWHDQTYFANVGVRAESTMEIAGSEHVLHGGMRAHREWLPSYSIDRAAFGSSTFVPTTNSSFRLMALSAHLDDTFTPLPNLDVTAGVRVEYIPSVSGTDRVAGFTYEDEFFDLLPAVGLAYSVNPDLAIFANYGEGFRAPQFWGFAYAANPKDALDFESGRSSEIGVRFENLGPVRGSLAYWQLDFDDYLVFDTGYYENVGRIKSQGMDLNVQFDFGDVVRALEGLQWNSSVTLQQAELQTGTDAGNEVPYAWESKASWRLRYAEPSGFSTSLGGAFVGESYSDTANTAATSADGRIGLNSSVVLWDAQAGYEFELSQRATLQFVVGASNLFDKEWEVHSRGGFFGPGLVAGAPRQSYAAFYLEIM